MIDERHLNGTTGESKSYTITNNGTTYFTVKGEPKMKPTNVEPTWEQVKEYCNKRCLVIMDGEIYDALRARANQVAPDMIYGYPIEQLVLFASACRQQGITENELHDFVLNVQNAYDIVHKEFENSMKECIERMMIHETN